MLAFFALGKFASTVSSAAASAGSTEVWNLSILGKRISDWRKASKVLPLVGVLCLKHCLLLESVRSSFMQVRLLGLLSELTVLNLI
jgi:hypothetical protein